MKLFEGGLFPPLDEGMPYVKKVLYLYNTELPTEELSMESSRKSAYNPKADKDQKRKRRENQKQQQILRYQQNPRQKSVIPNSSESRFPPPRPCENSLSFFSFHVFGFLEFFFLLSSVLLVSTVSVWKRMCCIPGWPQWTSARHVKKCTGDFFLLVFAAFEHIDYFVILYG